MGKARAQRTMLRHPKQGHTVARVGLAVVAVTGRVATAVGVAAATVKGVEPAPRRAGTEAATAARAP